MKSLIAVLVTLIIFHTVLLVILIIFHTVLLVILIIFRTSNTDYISVILIIFHEIKCYSTAEIRSHVAVFMKLDEMRSEDVF